MDLEQATLCSSKNRFVDEGEQGYSLPSKSVNFLEAKTHCRGNCF